MSIQRRLKAAKIPEGEIKVILANLNKLELAGISKATIENVVNNINMNAVRAVISKDNPLEKLRKMVKDNFE